MTNENDSKNKPLISFSTPGSFTGEWQRILANTHSRMLHIKGLGHIFEDISGSMPAEPEEPK